MWYYYPVVLYLFLCLHNILSQPINDNLFSSVDRNNDKQIDSHELNDYIASSIGGNEFDTTYELMTATNDGFHNILHTQNNRHTGDKYGYGYNHDDRHALKRADYDIYWDKLGSLLTVNEVCDWITYSIQLPQLSYLFKQNAITGYDFNELLRDDVLLNELHIESSIHRKQIIRAIKIKLLGIIDIPHTIESIDVIAYDCDELVIAWTPAYSHNAPIIQYRIQRRRQLNNITSTNKSQYTEWNTIGTSIESQYLDTELKPHATYQYRIDAFNIVGHSPWSNITQHSTHEPCQSKISLQLNDPSIQSNIQYKLAEHNGIISTILYYIKYLLHNILISAITSICLWHTWKHYKQQHDNIPISIAPQQPLISSSNNQQINDQTELVTSRSHNTIPNVSSLDIPHSTHRDAQTSPMIHSTNDTFNYNSSMKSDIPSMQRHTSYNGTVRAAVAAMQLRHRAQQSRLDRDNLLYYDSKSNGSDNNLLHTNNTTSSNTLDVQSNDSIELSAIELEQYQRKQSYDDMSLDDKSKHCCVCYHKFKSIQSLIKRHYCCMCHMSFHAQHGIVKHINLSPCGVPGTCICNHCHRLVEHERQQKFKLNQAKLAQYKISTTNNQ